MLLLKCDFIRGTEPFFPMDRHRGIRGHNFYETYEWGARADFCR